MKEDLRAAHLGDQQSRNLRNAVIVTFALPMAGTLAKICRHFFVFSRADELKCAFLTTLYYLPGDLLVCSLLAIRSRTLTGTVSKSIHNLIRSHYR